MKKNIFLILATVFTISACDLNKTPLAALSPDSYFSTANEMDAFANNFYPDLPGTSVYEEESDMIIKMGLTNEMRGARTVPGSGGGWSWTALRKYNTLIDFSGNCKDDNVRNEYVAVARFFRAYFYFDKVKRFGDVPWYDTQLGSADEALYKPRDSRELVMAHVVEDLDFAIEHLPTQHSLYKVTKWTAMALKTRACLFEGTFRKYHNISFPEHSWQWYLEQAAQAGEEFIATSGYSIYKGSDQPYRDLFASTNAIGTEVILARDYDATLNIKHNGTYYTLGNYGNPGMTRKMFCTYLMADGTRFTDKEGWQTMSFVDETKNRDPRLGQSIRIPGYKRIAATQTEPPSLADSETGYQPTKYMQGVDLGVDLYGASYNDLPLFRFADILLMKAEALARLDRLLLDKINLAEANAKPDPYLQAAETGYPNVTGPNAGVILEIRRERTVELFDENFRYYDIIRWKNGQAFKHQNLGLYFPGPGKYDLDGDGVIDHAIYTDTKPTDIPSTAITRKIGTDIFLTNGTSGYVLTNPTDPGSWNENRDYYYPIPTDELSLNENLVQNPGW